MAKPIFSGHLRHVGTFCGFIFFLKCMDSKLRCSCGEVVQGNFGAAEKMVVEGPMTLFPGHAGER